MSAFGELELDSPVAAVGGLVVARVDWAVLAEAGGRKGLWGNALVDQEIDHGDRSRRRQLPVRAERGTPDRLPVRVPVHAQDPVELWRDARRHLLQRVRELAQLALAFRIERGRARREQQFGLEYEPVADHAQIGAVAQRLAQPPEEFRAVFLQLLDLAYQRLAQLRIQPLNLLLLGVDLGLGGREQLVEPEDLPFQPVRLAVQVRHGGLAGPGLV